MKTFCKCGQPIINYYLCNDSKDEYCGECIFWINTSLQELSHQDEVKKFCTLFNIMDEGKTL